MQTHTHIYVCTSVHTEQEFVCINSHAIVTNNTLLPWFQQTLSTFTVQNSTFHCNATENRTSLPQKGVMNSVFSLILSEFTLEELTKFGDLPQITYRSTEQIPKGCKKRWRGCVLSQHGCVSSWRGVCQGGKSLWGVFDLCKAEGRWCSLQDRKVVVEKAPLPGLRLSLGSQPQSMGPSFISIIIK